VIFKDPVLLLDNGACPYLEGRSWQVELFTADSMEGARYEDLLASGWRRSGSVFYRNKCPGCALCYPIRLDASRAAPTKSQRRVLRKNSDVTVKLLPSRFDRRSYELYARYVAARHADAKDAENPSPRSYESFLIRSPLKSVISRYVAAAPEGEILVGNGYLDVLRDGLSSVYFVFDPDQGRRSLGTLSVFKEAELCVRHGLRWYYLGFYVPGSRKMAYKRNFRPYQVAIDGEWRDVEL
jgi:leucyl-tRNA---protein transferase